MSPHLVGEILTDANYMDKANSPDEIIDLVNENDEVIGVVKRKDADSNPELIHREIKIIIVDDQDRILMQKRSKKKKLLPGLWVESCGGHIPAGMSPEQGAHKELREELGFDTELMFINKIFRTHSRESRFSYHYIGKLPTNTKIVFEPEEIEAVKFVTEEEFDVLAKELNLQQYSFYEMFKSYWYGKI